MVAPAVVAAIAAVVSAGLKYGADAMGARAQKKLDKKSAKEQKRQTLGDMYSKNKDREHGLHKFNQDQKGENNGKRSQALQDTSSGFTRAINQGRQK